MDTVNLTPMFITAEELIVYSASRDLAPPPGVPAAVAALAQSDCRQAILEYAARVLVTRGLSTGGGGEQTDVDMVLRLLCDPPARIVVGAGDGNGGKVAYQAFSLSAEVCAIQAWDALNLHAVVGRPLAEADAAVRAAARLDLVGLAGDGPKFALGRDEVDAAVGDGLAAVERLVAPHAGDSADGSVLAAALFGKGAGTSVIAEFRGDGGGWAEAYGWFGPGPDGAWLIRSEGLPGSAEGGGDLTVERVGRAGLEAVVDRTMSSTVGALIR
jgi:hypothetical protein